MENHERKVDPEEIVSEEFIQAMEQWTVRYFRENEEDNEVRTSWLKFLEDLRTKSILMRIKES